MKLKTKVFILLLMAGTGVASAQTPAGGSRIVRVLTFNILHGATLRGDFNLDVIAAVIKGADPDFVALQEVDYMTERDLNARPGSAPINILCELWGASDNQDRILPTYPSDHPVKKIDYVMFYPKNRWRVLETRVIQDTVASDHCAYLSVLELVEEN